MDLIVETDLFIFGKYLIEEKKAICINWKMASIINSLLTFAKFS